MDILDGTTVENKGKLILNNLYYENGLMYSHRSTAHVQTYEGTFSGTHLHQVVF